MLLLRAAEIASGAEVDHLDRTLVLKQHDVVGLQVAVNQGWRHVMHVGKHVANILAPFDDLLQVERLVVVAFHQLEQVLPANKFQDEVGRLALFDQIVNARDCGESLQITQNGRLATEEVQPDLELLGIAADHFLDGHRAIAALGIGSHIDLSETAVGQVLVDPVAVVQHGARRIAQRRGATLAGTFAWRIGHAAGRVGTKVGRPFHLH